MSEFTITKENHEIRAQSRSLLSGNWGTAVLVILVYGILTGIGSSSGGSTSGEGGWFSGIIIGLVSVLAILGLAYTILVGNVIEYGSQITFLRFTRDKKIVFENLFSGFKDFGRVVATMFLKNLFIFLWALLLIIPGIIKSYAYALTEYLLEDNPNLDALSAITKSKQMMNGWKGKLFLLDLSLIGWWFLCLFTCGIGFLWLGAYFKSNRAVFYMEMVGSEDTDEKDYDEITVEAAQKEIERINKVESDFR
ncbi:MAG: DUF975 family protein [Clostridia bacterium]|nr:DUF975 family protein [Clostridia bacterium]